MTDKRQNVRTHQPDSPSEGNYDTNERADERATIVEPDKLSKGPQGVGARMHGWFQKLKRR